MFPSFHSGSQCFAEVSSTLDFDELEGSHLELADGDATRHLLAMLVEDNAETRNACGVHVNKPSPRRCAGPVTCPGAAAEARSIDRGVSRILQELGLLNDAVVPVAAAGEDEVLADLEQLQRELRMKTAECRGRMDKVRSLPTLPSPLHTRSDQMSFVPSHIFHLPLFCWVEGESASLILTLHMGRGWNHSCYDMFWTRSG
jgi:hypothetical protein